MSSFFSTSSVPAFVPPPPPTPAQLKSLAAVPSGMRMLPTGLRRALTLGSSGRRVPKGRRRRRGSSRGGSNSTQPSVSISRCVGNDQALPWSRQVRNLTEVKLTLLCDPTALFTSSTSIPVYAGATFQLSDIAQYADYVACFDEYRIDAVEVMIIPNITENTSAATATGILASAVDIDDGNTPASLDTVSAHENCVESAGTMTHYHRWAPTFAVATYSGAFTSYSADRGWVDCGSPSVQHFGLKAFITPTTTATVFSIVKRYTVSFRGIH